MLDVKKLIAGFLILAAGASASAWILSSVQSSGNASALSATETAAPTSSPSLGTSGFAADQSANNSIAIITSSTASAGNPNNITDDLADAFVSGIVASNPNGALSMSAGDANLAAPDQQTIAEALQNEPGLTNMTAPNWDTEVSQLQGEIKTVPDSTSAIINYINGFTAINTQQLTQSGLQAAMTSGSTEDASILPKAGVAVSNMLSAATALSVPTSFVDFQKSFIKMLVYEKNVYLLAQNASVDPAKTALTLQYEDDNYNQAIQDFNAETQKSIDSFYTVGTNSSQPQDGTLALINNIFFINTANAQGFPVIDAIGHFLQALGVSQTVAASWSTYLAKIAQDVALQIVKNTLTSLIQQKVLTWIQGNGTPRFIQQWGTTLVNAGTQSALNALNNQMACVSPLFAGPLQLTLGAYYLPNQNSCASQFQSFLGSGSNLQSFYNNFSNGGFVSFGQTLLPSNDYYGQLFFTAQNVALAGQNAQTASQAKAVAGQGFTGSQVCADGSNPNGTSATCIGPNGLGYQPAADGSCPAGYTKGMGPNNGLCANGQEPSVTTPSIVTGQQLNAAIGSSPNLIAAANSVAGIINALASSLIASIAQTAVTAATQSINSAINSPGNSGGILSVASSQLATASGPSLVGSPVQCSPSQTLAVLDASTSIATVNFNGEGGATDINCASNNAECSPGENTDGTPTYTWTASGSISTSGGTNAAVPFVATYNAPGTYFVIVTASTDNSTSSCEVDVSTLNNSTTTTL